MSLFYSKVCKTMVALGLLLTFSISTVMAETIAVIGTGSVGGALGPRFTEIGYDVIYGSRTPDSESVRALVAKSPDRASATTPDKAAQAATIILLAVPWTAAEQVVKNLGDLSGKIIIDPINPRVVNDDGFADYPSHMSNAEQVQNLAPDAHIVKAFSSISADTMIDPRIISHSVTIPLAGNDVEAKNKIAEICQKLGFETLDFGPVRYAHIIEGLYLLRRNARLNDNSFEWNYPSRER